LNESQGHKGQVKLHCLRIVDVPKKVHETTAVPAHGPEARFPHIPSQDDEDEDGDDAARTKAPVTRRV
jgi:hypothetical protein